MKFSQLGIGQPFQYKGNSYQKISPIMAAALEGQKQKLIPRSAEVVLINNDDKHFTNTAIDPAVSYQHLKNAVENEIINAAMDDAVKQALLEKTSFYFKRYRTETTLK